MTSPMIHTATWYDAKRYGREMWRTTVHGNPGAEYAGERESWVATDGSVPMQGLEHLHAPAEPDAGS